MYVFLCYNNTYCVQVFKGLKVRQCHPFHFQILEVLSNPTSRLPSWRSFVPDCEDTVWDTQVSEFLDNSALRLPPVMTNLSSAGDAALTPLKTCFSIISLITKVFASSLPIAERKVRTRSSKQSTGQK